MKKYTLGVDFGTLSARGVLVDVKSGEVVCDAVSEYRHGVIDRTLLKTNAPLPQDFALQDAADYLESFRTVVTDIIKSSAVAPKDIIGVCVDFTCCTLVPTKEDGTALSFIDEFSREPHAYVKLWKHHAAQYCADIFNAKASELCPELLSRFGGKISPEWLFPKAMELIDRAPHIYDAADLLLDAGDYITYLLTGKLTRGYDFAAYKTLYHHETGYPSKEFLAAIDPKLENIVETKLRGEVIPTAKLAGRVSALSRERFGVSPDEPWLEEGTAVACPVPDGHSVAAALNASHDGDMYALFGTSSNYMLASSEYKLMDGICGVVKDGLYPGFYAYEAGLCCFGDHFAWAVENVCPHHYHEKAQARGISDIQYLSELAEAQKPGESGVIALNWFNGNRNPLTNYALSGAFIGMTLLTKPEDLFRALVEANAFGTRLIIENFENNGVKVDRLTAAGGITFKSPFVMQTLADVLGKELYGASYLHSGSLASAIYASVAAGGSEGGYDDLADACKAMSDPCPRVFKPDAEAHAVYDMLYKEYLTLVDYFGRGANDVMKRLKKISSEKGTQK